MNQKLEAIAQDAARDLVALIRDGEDDILEAWSKAEEEAQQNETAPKFKLGLSITLDLDKNTQENALKWSVSHKLSACKTIPDPTQPDLPMDQSTVTISTPGMPPVTMTDAQFKKAAKALSGKKHS